MANFDLHNLELNDNQFDTLPAGTYRFRVTELEEGFYSGNSEKIPNGTQQIIAHFDVPYTSESGDYRIASVKSTFNIYAKALFALRQFAECIGMCKENGKFTQAKLVLGGVAPVPVELNEVEGFLVGKAPDEETAKEAAKLATKHCNPMWKNKYKVVEIEAMVEKAILAQK
jgi:CO/xanthine dehydrogenase FAD-binding subunit